MALTLMGRPIHFSLKWLKPPEVPPDGAMTLFEHLRELRYRLIVAALAIIVGMTICAFFVDPLFALLRHPYDLAITQLKIQKPNASTTLVTSGLASPFTLALKICLVGGLILSSPVWLWQLWSFIVPGLLAKEKKWAMIFIGAASPLFFAGVVVAYIILPKGITVLLGFTQNGITNMQDISVFLAFLLRFMVVFGVAFLIPLVVLMLNILGVIKASQLSKYRVYVIFATFVFGAVATPSTDPFSMLALAIPMAMLFLAAEVIAHILDRRKARRLTTAEGEVALRGSVDDDLALRALEEDPPPGDRRDEA